MEIRWTYEEAEPEILKWARVYHKKYRRLFEFDELVSVGWRGAQYATKQSHIGSAVRFGLKYFVGRELSKRSRHIKTVSLDLFERPETIFIKETKNYLYDTPKHNEYAFIEDVFKYLKRPIDRAIIEMTLANYSRREIADKLHIPSRQAVSARYRAIISKLARKFTKTDY